VDLDRIFKKSCGASLNTPSDMGTMDSINLRFDNANEQIRDGAYPLHMAVIAGAPLSVLEMLMKEEVSILLEIDKYGQIPLHLDLLYHAGEEIVATLANYGTGALSIREKKKGNLPLHTASSVGLLVHASKCMIESYHESIHEEPNTAGLIPLDVAMQGGKCSEEVLHLLQISNRA